MNMRTMTTGTAWALALCLAGACAALIAGIARPTAAAPPPVYTPDQSRALAVWAAQCDALGRLTEMVLGAKLASGKTVGEALGPGSDAEIALRLFLRSARPAAEPRVYSDGVVQMDIEVGMNSLVRCLRGLGALAPPDAGTASTASASSAAAALPALQSQAVDGYLRATGSGVAPRDLAPDAVRRAEAARPEEFPELFPLGWENVTAAGRVEAIRQARVRAYAAVGELIRDMRLSQTEKAGDAIAASTIAQVMVDSFVRSQPVEGEPRMMPDRIAEVDVAVSVRDLIRLLKDIRLLGGPAARWTEEQVDHLSVRLKTDRLTATGRGMPPPAEVRPAEPPRAAPGAPPPDWAGTTVEARATANVNEDVENPDEARLLAARLAKARALADIEKQVAQIKLDDGRTVRQRAGKDEVFLRDLKTFLSSARTVVYRPTGDGKAWEVVLKLPLLRLYECSRPRE